MSSSSIPSTFLKNVLNNGIGRYVCQLQRITFVFCKQKGDSRGTRDFIENKLLDFTNSNPGVAVYLQPRNNRSPKLVAEYLNGGRESIVTAKMSDDEIYKWLEHLRGRSGIKIARIRKPQHTENPSVQGVWHPFTNKDSSLNKTQFPIQELSEVPHEITTTDKLLEIAKKLREADVSMKE
ncbi:39S ribosomal protein L43, mitochondrial [Patella vulgata]|uniref:39S ribosomal protein L43, mitochondrial n=1 Tax=Patella vulgata TaxID=6465 RepID=UPI00217F6B17|nr:39S ribosomal protein L43, mitochondrial [Patella vulgata]